MKGHNQKNLTSSCNIHPVEFIEGVCPLCLNERLLVLASLQRLRPQSPPVSYQTIQEPKTIYSRKKPIRLSSFLSFFELRHHDQKYDHQNTSIIISPEDSYISINFKDNRATSWEKGKENCQLEHCEASWDHRYEHVMLHTTKETIPQPTQRSLGTWRKHIRRILRVISFKRRSRACHLSAKVKDEDDLRRGWLRSSYPIIKIPPN